MTSKTRSMNSAGTAPWKRSLMLLTKMRPVEQTEVFACHLFVDLLEGRAPRSALNKAEGLPFHQRQKLLLPPVIRERCGTQLLEKESIRTSDGVHRRGLVGAIGHAES